MRSDFHPSGQIGSQRSGSFTEAARREQIILGAISVLARRGYSGTSLAVIAVELGISKGVISYHFSGKAELLQEVVRSVLARAEAWMTPRVAGTASFTQALRVYIESNLAFLDSHRDETIALTEVLSNARATDGVPELFDETQRSAIGALEMLFIGGQHAGEFADFAPRTAAIALRAAIDSATGFLREATDFDTVAFGSELASLYERATNKGTEER
jgi:AcrR family transcriptional regulator